MARMSRKELEKRIVELENAVRALSQMHSRTLSELAAGQKYIGCLSHPNSLVARNPAKTSYGYVSFEDLAKFVVDGKPLEFKEKDKELVTEVHPDGTEIKKVVDKEKKTKYVAPYKIKDTTSWLVEMQRAMKMAGM